MSSVTPQPVKPQPVPTAQPATDPPSKPKTKTTTKSAAPAETDERSATLRVAPAIHADLRVASSVLRMHTYDLTNQLLRAALEALCKENPRLSAVLREG